MHIVIPLSGQGQRFLDAGYPAPKTLIKVDKKPIIEHVLQLFPGETHITFICREDHLKETPLKETLQKIAPTGTISAIPPHQKGPVFSVLQIIEQIEEQEEVIVTYCDFGTYWDYQDFLDHTRKRNADGAIPAYRGFHPHSLYSTSYAFLKEKEQYLFAAKEKEPFTKNWQNEYISNGTYYFKKGAYLKKYFTQLIERNITTNGEFFVSLVYNLMLQDQLKVSLYEIQHMLQWGTPQDLKEYQFWSKHFAQNKAPSKNTPKKGNHFICLKGTSINELEKIFLPINGKCVISESLTSQLSFEKQFFLIPCSFPTSFQKKLLQLFPNVQIISTPTNNWLILYQKALKQINLAEPLFISNATQFYVWQPEKFAQLPTTTNFACWGFQNNPLLHRTPQNYHWLHINNQNKITQFFNKTSPHQNSFPKKNQEKEYAVGEALYFSKAHFFATTINLVSTENKIQNDPFSLSLYSLLLKSLTGTLIEANSIFFWDHLTEYKTFNYWQSFFHKSSSHSYSLSKDSNLSTTEIAALDQQFRSFQQKYR